VRSLAVVLFVTQAILSISNTKCSVSGFWVLDAVFAFGFGSNVDEALNWKMESLAKVDRFPDGASTMEGNIVLDVDPNWKTVLSVGNWDVVSN